MKSIILSILIGVSLLSSSFAAEKTKLNILIKNSFKSQFQNVKDVTWETKPDYAAATFTINGLKVQAFYDYNGQAIGTSQAISLDQLPAKAKRTLAKKYSNHIIKEAIKFETIDETAYFISASNENSSTVIKIAGGQLSVFK